MEYTDANRGIIQDRERARQIVDFHGLRYGNITPTDIDGFFEYHNKAFVFYEMKYGAKELPQGQKVALERLVDACWKSGAKAALIICEHDAENPNDDIHAATTKVRAVYLGEKYGYCIDSRKRTAKQITDGFMKWNPERVI